MYSKDMYPSTPRYLSTEITRACKNYLPGLYRWIDLQRHKHNMRKLAVKLYGMDRESAEAVSMTIEMYYQTETGAERLAGRVAEIMAVPMEPISE